MRVWLMAIVVCAVTFCVAGAVFMQQSDTYGDMEAATTRIAVAVARSDHQTLVRDPLLQDRPEIIARLRNYETVLASGYRIRIARNSGKWSEFPTDRVTHLGVIETSVGTLLLGFRSERDSGALSLVAVAFSIID